MPADPDNFRDSLRAFPTGVTVVTAIGPDGPSGATANAVTSLSLDPPLMLAALDRGSRTLVSVRSSGAFAVNVLASGQERLARRFSSKDPEPSKWEGVGWSELDGAPRLDGAVAWIRCELRELIEGGDHLILTGAVLDSEAAGGDPLIFHAGGYRGLGA